MDHSELIREMKSKNRTDLTKLIGSAKAFGDIVEKMSQPFIGFQVDKVVAIDALGFVFGGAIAKELGVGLVLIRKKGKSAWRIESEKVVDYTGKEIVLEIVEDSLSEDNKVLIVDDWSETGGQLKSVIKLVEKLGAEIVGVSMLNIDKKVMNDKDLQKYNLHSAVNY